jgi:D-psicose/D-tagatose/L-ribulose 3-epimerase
MKVGFNLLVLGGLITDAHAHELQSLAKLGYDGVEIPILDGDVTHYRRLAKHCADLGLSRTASSALLGDANPCSKEAPLRQAAYDRLRWMIDNAHALEAPTICGPLYAPLGFFTGHGPTEDELLHAADTLRAAADHGAQAGVTLLLEPLNRFETYVLNTVEQGMAFVRQVDHPHIRLMYDTFHANIEERSPVNVFAQNAREFAHIHISENDRGIPGRGHAALAPTIAAARQSGYDQWLVVEAFGRAVPELAAATRVWRDLFPDLETLFMESIRFIRSHWDAAGGKAGSGRTAPDLEPIA